MFFRWYAGTKQESPTRKQQWKFQKKSWCKRRHLQTVPVLFPQRVKARKHLHPSDNGEWTERQPGKHVYTFNCEGWPYPTLPNPTLHVKDDPSQVNRPQLWVALMCPNAHQHVAPPHVLPCQLLCLFMYCVLVGSPIPSSNPPPPPHTPIPRSSTSRICSARQTGTPLPPLPLCLHLPHHCISICSSPGANNAIHTTHHKKYKCKYK